VWHELNKGWKLWEKAGAGGEVAKVFKDLHTKSKLVVSLSPSSSCKACRAAPTSPGPTKPTISAEEGLTKRRGSRPHHPACRTARPPAAICFHLKYASCCADNPHWCPPWLWPSGGSYLKIVTQILQDATRLGNFSEAPPKCGSLWKNHFSTQATSPSKPSVCGRARLFCIRREVRGHVFPPGAFHKGFSQWSFGQSEINMIRVAKSFLRICRAPPQGSRRACSSMVLEHGSPASQRVKSLYYDTVFAAERIVIMGRSVIG